MLVPIKYFVFTIDIKVSENRLGLGVWVWLYNGNSKELPSDGHALTLTCVYTNTLTVVLLCSFLRYCH